MAEAAIDFPAMMLANAQAQLEDHQYAAAGILLAQVAVEMAALQAFANPIAARHQPA